MPRIAKDVAEFNGGFRRGELDAGAAVLPIASGGRQLIGTCSRNASLAASLDWRGHIP
jgi:hypothetical protein